MFKGIKGRVQKLSFVLVRVLGKIKSYLQHPGKIILYLGRKGLLGFVPDELYLRLIWRVRLGSRLTLTPHGFDEKYSGLNYMIGIRFSA